MAVEIRDKATVHGEKLVDPLFEVDDSCYSYYSSLTVPKPLTLLNT